VSTQPVERDEWVVIDFETASSRGTPCQVGAIRFVEGREVDALSTYVFQPPHLFDAFNIALHGITPGDVEAAPLWPTVRDQLTEFAGGAPLVAHYAPFDIGVVRDACDLCEIDWPTIRYACTVSISRQVWPSLGSYSLLLLCGKLGITSDPAQHHDALYDARLAARVLQRAMETRGATGLADLLNQVYIRLGEISPHGWYGSHHRLMAANALSPSPDADPESPFYGKVVAFTGQLAMVRRQAWSFVAAAGGQPADSVTQKTDFLVCGYQDMFRLAMGESKSQKLRRAEQLHAEGATIEILSERDFFRLLE
jgi:DNA polymerase-3 subunit epsilon